MADKSKVLKALDHCARMFMHLEICNGCPYHRTIAPPCEAALMRDAAALIKQEPVKPDEVFVNNPSPEPDQWLFICPICTNDVENGDRYCKHCGRELKWHD